MASRAERKLQDSTYHGERRNWNFEKYVTTHKEAACQLRQTEPHLPWQNAAEGTIRELRRGAARKMSKTGLILCLNDQI